MAYIVPCRCHGDDHADRARPRLQPPAFADFADPTPAPGEVLVEVRAAGVHHIVRALAAGEAYALDAQPPFVPGVDGVSVTPDGQRVYFGGVRPPYGTLAPQAPVASGRWLPLPDGIDDATARRLFNPAGSSFLALPARRARRRRDGGRARRDRRVGPARGAGGARARGRPHRRRRRNRAVLAGLGALGADAVGGARRCPRASGNSAPRCATPPPARSTSSSTTSWGAPAAGRRIAAGSAPRRDARRVRPGQVGQAAVPTPRARRRPPPQLGPRAPRQPGLGSVSLTQAIAAMGGVLGLYLGGALSIAVDARPLSEVARAWTSSLPGKRLVLVP
ncbi:MAG: hypothetical protein U1F43_29325 [Myxococcota bacterium]